MPLQPTFEQFIRPAPPPVDKKLLGDLQRRECTNNVIAFQVQMGIHQIASAANDIIDEETFHLLQRMRGIAFAGFAPRPEDLDQLDATARRSASSVTEAVQAFTAAIRVLMERQSAHWRMTGYQGELLLQHQDTDAVAEMADTLGGRIFVSGSARLGEGTPAYDAARWVIATIVEGMPHPDGTTEQAITGAGPGIMEAASRGAMEGAWRHLQHLLKERQRPDADPASVLDRIATFRKQLQSVGARIILPFEASWNSHLQLNLTIKSFGPRKLALASVAGGRSMNQPKERNTNGWHGRHPAMFSFTGGFGTADEDWEIATLEQCGKTQVPIPIFIVGQGKIDVFEQTLETMQREGVIDPDDRDIFHFCPTEIEAVEQYLDYYHLSPSPHIERAIRRRRNCLALQPQRSRRSGTSPSFPQYSGEKLPCQRRLFE